VDEESGPDIFALDCTIHPNRSRLLFNLSSFSVNICDTELCLQALIPCHSDRITASAFSVLNNDIFYTSSSDCTAKSWDLRVGLAPTSTVSFDSDVFAMAVNQFDNLLVLGVESSIIFYDKRMLSGNVRNQLRLGTYSDVHSDDLTQLQFHPSFPNILASSGEDGLLCLYNIGASEGSEASISIMNTDCPISKFGFFGPKGEGVYSISSIETFSIWHHPSAQRLATFNDIRDSTGAEYLIDCVEVSPDEELLLLTGKHNGEMNVIAVSPNSYHPTGTLLQGHSSMVRSICPVKYSVDNSTKVGLLSTGEDGTVARYSNILPDSTDQNQRVPNVLGKRRAEESISNSSKKLATGQSNNN
jgi:WD40 repeat protein